MKINLLCWSVDKVDVVDRVDVVDGVEAVNDVIFDPGNWVIENQRQDCRRWRNELRRL
jgi:hypothetical protein